MNIKYYKSILRLSLVAVLIFCDTSRKEMLHIKPDRDIPGADVININISLRQSSERYG